MERGKDEEKRGRMKAREKDEERRGEGLLHVSSRGWGAAIWGSAPHTT